MRKLLLAFAAGLIGVCGAFAPATPVAAASNLKAVIVVGATGSTTPSYRADADDAAATFRKYTSNVVKVYSPNATWPAVQAAAKGANFVVYIGHGSGWPNPYAPGHHTTGFPGDNGMGLNDPKRGTGDSNTNYWGEDYMAQLGLAPNAVVFLWHLCYASGDNEWGQGLPTRSVAQTRIDGYASGFIRGGARAVIAEGVGDISPYINAIFTQHTTIDRVWKTAPNFHNHVSSWASTHVDGSTNRYTGLGMTSQMDPDLDHPAADKDVYYRSMVAATSLTTDQILSGAPQPAPFVSKTGKFTPIEPVRILDTRGALGLSGAFVSKTPRTFKVTGIPSTAIAVTGNLTVTGQTAAGYVFVGPSVDSVPPPSSTINFPAGDTRANGVTVALGAGGTLAAVYMGTNGSRADVVFDVTGYFDPAAGLGYVKYGPNRVLDTRSSTTVGRLVAGQPRTVQIGGANGIPAGAKAITGNLTIANQTSRGYVYVGPVATAKPASSTINFPVGDIRANNVTVMLGTDGSLSFTYYASTTPATADVILDVTGYFVEGSGASYHTLQPVRVLDPRVDLGVKNAFVSRTAQTFAVTAGGKVPTDAAAVSGNLTVTAQTGGGWAATGPTVAANAGFSNINFPLSDTRANGATVPVATGGSLQGMYASGSGGSAVLIFDVTGYYK